MGRAKSLRVAAPQLVKLLRFLAPYTRSSRPLILGAMGAMLGGVLMRVLEPWPLKIIFDHVIIPSGEPPLSMDALGQLSPMALLGMSAVALVMIVGLRAASNYFGKVGFALAGSRVMTKVRGKLFEHIHGLSLSFHSQARSGDLIVRVIGDIGMLKQVAITAFLPMVTSVLILLVMAALMVWLNWQLAVLILITLPAYWITTTRLGRRIQAVSRKQRQREGAMAATAAESLGAIESVQALAVEDVFSGLFSSQNKKSLKDGVKARKLASRLQGIVMFMTGVSTALVLLVGARQVLAGSLTPGELLVFLSYLKAAFRPMQDFSKYAGRLAKAAASGDRVIEIMALEPDIKDRPDATEAPRLKGSIRFEHVSFSYASNTPVLEDLLLDIPQGQTLALVGSSGAGKSTILNLIPRLYDPNAGRVLIDGTDLREWKIVSLRSQISVVLQDTALFVASVRDNIALGRPDLLDTEVEAAARLANAHDFIMAMPNGYDTMVGERGVTLSAGQRQRIAIARAAARKSPILLLDEPTSELDRHSEAEVVDALRKLARGRTTVLVTHNLEHASTADRIAVLSDGTVAEIGTHDTLMRLDGVYAGLCRRRLVGSHGGDGESLLSLEEEHGE